jgi:hypothetical protein
MLNPRYPPTRYIAQVDQGDYLAAMRTSMVNPEDMVITFDEMLRRTSFAGYMRTILKTLETHFRGPVDMEFTVEVADPHAAHPDVRLSILQCRHQSAMNEEGAQIPESLADEDIIFTTRRMVPHGAVLGIPYVVYVSPEEYFSLKSQALRTKLERAIGALNAALKGEVFICVGPGRWGTSTPDLGVHVGYGDIYSTYALVELSGKEIGTDPEPSFGTHFFQDLMEARIFPLAVNLDDLGTVFNRSFFNSTPNHLLEKIPCNEKAIQNCLR